jgi:hypothetical protein
LQLQRHGKSIMRLCLVLHSTTCHQAPRCLEHHQGGLISCGAASMARTAVKVLESLLDGSGHGVKWKLSSCSLRVVVDCRKPTTIWCVCCSGHANRLSPTAFAVSTVSPGTAHVTCSVCPNESLSAASSITLGRRTTFSSTLYSTHLPANINNNCARLQLPASTTSSAAAIVASASQP